ncbi:MAG: SDR family NAD(P)-dependent oxidoreductase [Candidatus Devosia phytovorans]|uniref:SDR family NAD(P)-dependent oxidoreductase n=1 Tax=Candidatus Devosia phytovorans TaxID=3121372 RepID=A0AAJ6B019_9HYPH|nr:SDR family NAD(P)-dependent oxidoreductase [Devosia sp.]WEK03729.1 MAG: SDR family NAD(P)-dependent oxidoreductase [Devosia sp.]
MLISGVAPLVDPLVVITGAGSGLGRAMAASFCRKGIPVVGFGRSPSTLGQAEDSIASAIFTAMVVNVADEDAVKLAFRTLRERHGDPSILINNAAVYPHRDFMEESGTTFMQTLAVNLGGVVNCSRAVLDTMTISGRGRIVNVGSFAGQAPTPAGSAYSVSKGAARIFTQALVADVADRFPDIVVSTWMPGVLNTQMGLANGLDPDIAAEWGVDLAMRNDRSLNGAEFERNTEILPSRSAKRRVLDAVLRRRPAPARILGQFTAEPKAA